MTDTVTATLAEWEALAEGATEGPWEWIDGPRQELANHTRGVLRCAALVEQAARKWIGGEG